MRRTWHLLRVATLPAVLLLGTPAVLVPLTRTTLPEHRPTPDELAAWAADPLTPATVTAVAVLGGWSIWLWVAASLLAHARSRLTIGRRVPQLRLPAPLHTVAAAVAGAAAVTAAGADAAAASATNAVLADTTAPHRHAHGQQHAAADNHITPVDNVEVSEVDGPGDYHAVTLHPTGTETAAARPPARRAAIGGRRTDHRPSAVVTRGDTLWDIAARHLDDPHRWPHIYHLNRDRYDANGHMRGGQHIEPGWRLRLPHAPSATPTPGRPSPRKQAAVPTTTTPTETLPPGTPRHPKPATTTNAPPTAAVTPPATALPHPDDGVAHPPGPATAAPPGPTAAGSDPAPTHTRGPQAGAKPGINLPGGSWMDLGLASAVVAAVALVWAHRRRRYAPRPPSPRLRLDDPDLAPMPPVITRLCRGLRRHTPATPIPLNAEPDIEVDSVDLDDDIDEQQDAEPGRATPGRAPVPGRCVAAVGQADAAPGPVAPAPANPLSAVWPPAGLGMTGPGAEAAARGFLTAALAAGGLHDPDARTWVVIPATTAATLLGPVAPTPPHTPRLTVTTGLAEALELLETQTMHRTRLMHRHEVDDVTALRAADPHEEPVAPIMLIADTAEPQERTRIAALLLQGQRLDIHGVLLGAWPDGDTIHVAGDGTTSPAVAQATRHGRHPADVGRFTVLDRTETADLIRTLAESHTGQPPAPAPTRTAEAHRTTPANGPGTACVVTGPPNPCNVRQPGTGDVPARGTADQAGDATTPVPPAAAGEGMTAQPHPEVTDAPPVPPAAAPVPATDDSMDGTRDRPDSGPVTAPAPTSGQVVVTVLGTTRIVHADPQRPLRKKSLELLVYLAVHDGTASTDAILDDLLPDAPASKAPHRLHTYVSDLRTVLRHAGGPDTYLTHPHHRYALNPDTIDVDLWRMRAALRDADTAPTPQERAAALRQAVDTYTGPLAGDYDYEWIESYREAARRQAHDASLALAAALTDQPTEQLKVLHTAIGHHPYADGLYQAAMLAQAQLGNLDGVRALRRTATRRLAEIDAEPSDDTIALADQLVARLQRPGRGARLRPAPEAADGAAA